MTRSVLTFALAVLSLPPTARAVWSQKIDLNIVVVQAEGDPPRVDVVSVKKGGVGDRMGLRPGDTILKINKTKIESIAQVDPATAADYIVVTVKSGDVTRRAKAMNSNNVMTEMRDGLRYQVTKDFLTVQRDPTEDGELAVPEEPPARPRLGVTAQSIDGGVKVVAVEAGSAATRGASPAGGAVWRLEPGDVIESVEGRSVGLIDGEEYPLGAELRRVKRGVTMSVRDARTGKVNRIRFDLPAAE